MQIFLESSHWNTHWEFRPMVGQQQETIRIAIAGLNLNLSRKKTTKSALLKISRDKDETSTIWWFPEIRVPLCFNGIFHHKPSIWGYPQLWKPPYSQLVKTESFGLWQGRNGAGDNWPRGVFSLYQRYGVTQNYNHHPGTLSLWKQ